MSETSEHELNDLVWRLSNGDPHEAGHSDDFGLANHVRVQNDDATRAVLAADFVTR